MKILSAEEVRLWDQYTILHEPIAPIDLMERASLQCAEWLMRHYPLADAFSIYCGKGNNGGDGLAIARMLLNKGYKVTVHILEFGHKGTDDFQINLARLHQTPNADIHFIQSEENFHPVPTGGIIIDALYGSGLNRNLEGVIAKLVEQLNASGNEIVSIDIPSGLFVDRSSKGNTIVSASHTLSFQCYKPAFLFAENAAWIGNIHILDIGLHSDFADTLDNRFELIDDETIHAIYKPRNQFSHKGHYGHALIIAGSYGKTSAVILAAKACLRSGVGLLTCHVPGSSYAILQTSVPEAMLLTDFNSAFCTRIEDDLSKYKAIGVGPGLGTATDTTTLLYQLFNTYQQPMVLDADALNIISTDDKLLKLIPATSILTPHPKEFERLFGKTNNDFDRALLAIQKAQELNVVIILKGHHTFIATPGGKGFFNSTGNAGMATAGSGDVLTGILTGLLAQNYSPVQAAILAVYIHGLAGDIVAKASMESLIARDIIENLGKAFLKIQE